MTINPIFQTIKIKDNLSCYFKLIKYPDGQKSIKLYLDYLDVKKPVVLVCRIKNFDELEVLLCVISALRKHDFHIAQLNFVYLFGMRSDRAFEVGNPNYFRDVVAPIINNLNVPEVRIFCPHSKVASSYVKNFYYYSIPIDRYPTDACLHIAGDANSFEVYNCVQIAMDAASFDKKRTGDSITVELCQEFENLIIKKASIKPVLIFDDLCDAGGTFISEAKYIRDKLKLSNPLYLFVAHGLFTKGIENVAPYFERIICTNSYQDIDHPKVTQINVI